MKLHENYCFSYIMLRQIWFYDNRFQSHENKVNSKQVVASSHSGKKVKQKTNS